MSLLLHPLTLPPFLTSSSISSSPHLHRPCLLYFPVVPKLAPSGSQDPSS